MREHDICYVNFMLSFVDLSYLTEFSSYYSFIYTRMMCTTEIDMLQYVVHTTSSIACTKEYVISCTLTF